MTFVTSCGTERVEKINMLKFLISEHAWNDVATNVQHEQSQQQHEGPVEERDLSWPI